MAGVTVATDGRQDASGCHRQRNEFIHDAQDQFHPVGHCQLVIQAFAVRVDGVGRDVEIVVKPAPPSRDTGRVTIHFA